MFEYKIGETTYEFNCKLGTTIKIKNKFGKKFQDVVKELGNFDIPELVKFLHTAVKGDVELTAFEENVYDNLGMMELYDLVQLLVKKIQYPELDEEEIDKKLEEKEKNLMTEKA